MQEFPLDPRALAELVETGSCAFRLPEALFDRDFPGHYLRKIRSVSLTMRCEAGSRPVVTAELTLVGSRVRTGPRAMGASEGLHDDRNFTTTSASKKSKVSGRPTGRGALELNFQDEGGLPFEGQGAISEWLLRISQESFDFSTISDVVIRLSYTARDGGASK